MDNLQRDQLMVTAPPMRPVQVQAPGNAPSKPGILSLDDIFDEFIFTNDKPQARSSGQTDKKPIESSETNCKDDEGYDSIDDEDDENDEDGEGRSKKRTRGLHSNMTEEQKVERR